ncbi:MAG: FtsX-like permease family protein [Gemmatimonadales bacterium]
MISRLRALAHALLHRSSIERSMDEEFAEHVALRTDDLVRQGLTPAEAARRARLEFGNFTAMKERAREAHGVRFLDDLLSDLRLALRTSRKHLVLSASILVTLSLGIGISSSVFTVADAVALRSHVSRDRDTFFHAFTFYSVDRKPVAGQGQASLSDYLALRKDLDMARAIAAYGTIIAGIGTDDAGGTRLLLTTCNFFAVQSPGQPLLGRFLEERDCDEASPVIVVSEVLWRTGLRADPAIVGKGLLVNGQPLTVIGVAPTATSEVGRERGWIPYTLQPLVTSDGNLLSGSDTPWLQLEGRLGKHPRAHVAAEVAAILARQDVLHPGRTTRTAVTDGSFIGDDVDGKNLTLRLTIALLTALTIVVVLVACANVTTLLLSRAEARRREMGVRIAMGAGRSRLVRMLLTETVFLAGIAGLASVWLTYRVPPLLVRYLAGQTLNYSLDPDWRVFLFVGCMTVLAGIAAGLAPALQSLDLDLVSAIKGGAGQSGLGAHRGSARGALIATQVALSVVLVSGSALFLKSSLQAASLDPRMETKRLMALAIGGDTKRGATSWEAFYPTIRRELLSSSAVQAVGFGSFVPYRDMGVPQLEVSDGVPRVVTTDEISPEYLDALGIPIVRGRGIRTGDPPCSTRHCPVVVSEAFVRSFVRTGDPIGVTIRTTGDTVLDIVGVARDVVSPFTGQVSQAIVYQPWTQGQAGYTTFARIGGDEALVRRVMEETVRTAFPGGFSGAQTLQSDIDRQRGDYWRLAQVVALLGVMAVGLVLIGIYGVVSFAVSQRTREIGLRLALGAKATHVYGTVVGRSLRPIAIGMVVGLALAVPGGVALTQVIGHMTGIDWRNPTAFVAAIAVLSVVSAIAMAVPARRALGVDPLTALREE